MSESNQQFTVKDNRKYIILYLILTKNGLELMPNQR